MTVCVERGATAPFETILAIGVARRGKGMNRPLAFDATVMIDTNSYRTIYLVNYLAGYKEEVHSSTVQEGGQKIERVVFPRENFRSAL